MLRKSKNLALKNADVFAVMHLRTAKRSILALKILLF